MTIVEAYSSLKCPILFDTGIVSEANSWSVDLFLECVRYITLSTPKMPIGIFGDSEKSDVR